MKTSIFKASTTVVIPCLALSLSACIFDSSKSDDKADKAPEKTVLATESDYVPKDGDEVKFLYTFSFMDNGLLAGSGGYYKITTYNIVDKLPQKYGYQHSEAGPYLKASSYDHIPSSHMQKTI